MSAAPIEAAARPDGGVPARLDLLHTLATGLVRRVSESDPAVGDPLRGLYLSPQVALHWGTRPPAGTPTTDPARQEYLETLATCGAPGDRLDALAGRCLLSVLDLHVLLAALAPEVDRRFEPLYGYLNDDVSRRRATVSLVLTLLGLGTDDPVVRARFHRAAPLSACGLLVVEEDRDRPFPGRGLRVPERVVAHLLGDDALDEALLGTVTRYPGAAAGDVSGEEHVASFGARLVRLLDTAPSGAHLRESRPGSDAARVADALHRAGRTVLRCELPPDTDPALASLLLREARLGDAVVVAGPLPEKPEAMVRALGGSDVPVVFVDPRPFDPRWSPAGAVVPVEPPPEAAATPGTWARALGADAADPELLSTTEGFRLGPDQVGAAVSAARAFAALDGVELTAEHLRRGARRQSAPLLGRHARHVEPEVGWPDLVLPDVPRTQLEELVLRARERTRVLREWGLRPGGGRGLGVTALFAGESGTGKTMSAEVVAGELGVALAVVDLSSVVDKYIGETEKNLDRIFTEADRADSVLLFDEADAVFGKRSEVKDSHDRYANLESAFLLQRLESFAGIAILTTNLRANIDEAFTRRLDLVVDFPFPDPALRATLWRQCLAGAPCEPGLELDALGRDYELSGGAIRSAAVTAAYLAAGRGTPIGDADTTTGARREYHKAGRVVW